MLFEVLPDTLFRIFGGKYAQAYAAILQRLHEGVFSIDVTDQPTKAEVITELNQGLAKFLEVQSQSVEDFKLTGPDAYSDLIQAGWLTEQREGWTTYVEMEAPVAMMLERLCGLSSSASETFGGTMVSVMSTLESAIKAPDVSSLGVIEAARRAREFARYVRTVVGTLKAIETEMLKQVSVNGLVRTFFDDFVERIVVGDYRKLTLAQNHPYSFKYKIIDLIETIQADTSLYDRICAGLVNQGVATTSQAAGHQVDASLRGVRGALDSIETFRWRIDRTKANIEQRFNNTLRYMDLLETGGAEKFDRALVSFGRSLGSKEKGTKQVEVRTALLVSPQHYDEGVFAGTSAPRKPIEPEKFRPHKADPLRLAFDRAKADFDKKITITPKQFVDYVDRKMSRKKKVSAEELSPKDVQEFVVLSAIRALPPGSRNLPNGTYVVPRDGWIENDWMICQNFEIVRGKAPSDAR